MNKNKKNTHIAYSLDVEADGPCAGLYSMLSFAVVPLDDPSRAFYVELAPTSDKFVPGALRACGFTREQTLEFTPADAAMARFQRWLENEPEAGRRVMWSDNPAFDWQFFNYYCHKYLGENAFGHSSRRIGDFWAGLQKNPSSAGSWKKMRTEAHTHNALDDARGNAGALKKILALPRSSAVDQLEVSKYILAKAGPAAGSMSDTTLDAAKQMDGSILWAIRQDGNCFNKQGEWEYEPTPSSRDENFFQRCRFGSAEAAVACWRKFNPNIGTRTSRRRRDPK